MNCAFHVQNAALVNCNGCSRPLCAGCDHRIKGFPYCEDCIVEGVNILRSTDRQQFAAMDRKRTYPIVAFALSWICPGLGAAYNGQMVKALVHFGIVAGLFQMAVSTGLAIFIIALLGMWWFFLPLDAWRSAKLIRAGIRPEETENLLVERLSSNAKLSGIILAGIGILFFINAILGKTVITKAVLPFLLIFFGLYLMRDYFFSRRGRSSAFGTSDSYPVPTSFAAANERFKDGPPKNSWRN